MSEFTPHFAPVVVLLFLGTALRLFLRCAADFVLHHLGCASRRPRNIPMFLFQPSAM
jgi:hypothetical protein